MSEDVYGCTGYWRTSRALWARRRLVQEETCHFCANRVFSGELMKGMNQLAYRPARANQISSSLVFLFFKSVFVLLDTAMKPDRRQRLLLVLRRVNDNNQYEVLVLHYVVVVFEIHQSLYRTSSRLPKWRGNVLESRLLK